MECFCQQILVWTSRKSSRKTSRILWGSGPVQLLLNFVEGFSRQIREGFEQVFEPRFETGLEKLENFFIELKTLASGEKKESLKKGFLLKMKIDFCEVAAAELLHPSFSKKKRLHPNRFLCLFGVEPVTAQQFHAKYLASTHLAQPKIFLWVLFFVKHYPNDITGFATFRRSNPRTFRDRVWEVLTFLGQQGRMWEITENARKTKLIIVDATELVVKRPVNSSAATALYSGYKKKTTLKYEVAVDEATHRPVHVSGPFAGPTGDITIFRGALKKLMEARGWLGLADGTYQGEQQLLDVPPRPYKNLTKKVRARCKRRAKRRCFVEIFFARMKKFRSLWEVWRHDLLKHRPVFLFVLNLVSMDLQRRPLRIGELPRVEMAMDPARNGLNQ